MHDSETSTRNGAVHLLHIAGGTHYNLLLIPALTPALKQAGTLVKKNDLSVGEKRKVAYGVSISEFKTSERQTASSINLAVLLVSPLPNLTRNSQVWPVLQAILNLKLVMFSYRTIIASLLP